MSNEKTNEHEKLISKKAMFHKYCKVHISLNDDKGWENGVIKEVGADNLILELSQAGKEKHGVDSLPLFFLEIKDITEYKIEVGA